MSRPFRLWVRCPPDEQNPDGFRIAETYIRFDSAIRAGRRMAGARNFHIDHHDPEYSYSAEEQVVLKVRRANGKHLYCAKESKRKSRAALGVEKLMSILRL